MKTQWNTGALYTREGQVLVAAKQGNRIYFWDHSRGLGYTFETDELITTEASLQSAVRRCYNSGSYDDKQDLHVPSNGWRRTGYFDRASGQMVWVDVDLSRN